MAANNINNDILRALQAQVDALRALVAAQGQPQQLRLFKGTQFEGGEGSAALRDFINNLANQWAANTQD